MAGAKSLRSSPTPSSRPTVYDSPSASRRQSTLSIGSSNSSNVSLPLHTSPSSTSPRVQLVPHVYRLSYDSSLSQTERDVLDSTSFDAFDLSSKDFDFEDIFTYDKPQRKLLPAVEKDWTNFTSSHYTSASAVRQKVNRNRSGLGEMYVKNKMDARKR